MGETGYDEQRLYLENLNGRPYTGLVGAKVIAVNEERDFTVYLTEDDRVIVYGAEDLRYDVVEDPQVELRHILVPEEYIDAMFALDLPAEIDL